MMTPMPAVFAASVPVLVTWILEGTRIIVPRCQRMRTLVKVLSAINPWPNLRLTISHRRRPQVSKIMASVRGQLVFMVPTFYVVITNDSNLVIKASCVNLHTVKRKEKPGKKNGKKVLEVFTQSVARKY